MSDRRSIEIAESKEELLKSIKRAARACSWCRSGAPLREDGRHIAGTLTHGVVVDECTLGDLGFIIDFAYKVLAKK